MATTGQQQHHQCHNHSEGCACKPSLPVHFGASSEVRNLNNRAAVLVSNGNFTEARTVYEVALTKHIQITCGKFGVCNKCDVTSCPSSSYSADDSAMVGSDDDLSFGGNSAFVDSEHFPEEEERSLDMRNDLMLLDRDPQHQGGNDAPVVSATVAVTSGREFHFRHDTSYKPCQKTRTSRISSSSQLKTSSYCGQGVNRPPSEWMHHHILSMPIVLDSTEWEATTTEMRSFVLIFNSALCNHLQGIEFLSQHQPSPILDHTPLYRGPFQIAKVLYELALKALTDAHSKARTGLALRGLDRLCCSSVFNNLSHVCKILQGGQSCEAQYYDTLLLKSIYWLIDGACSDNESNTNQSRPSLVSSRSGAISSVNDVLDTASNVNGRNDGAHYHNDEAEIIDAFLENVFYLIGARESMVPAAAA